MRIYALLFLNKYIYKYKFIYIVQTGCKICICITRQYKTMQNLHLHFLHCKLYTCTKYIYNNKLRCKLMSSILICSSFAPLAVVAFFPFFCRFFADFRPFSALLRVCVFSRVFALFFVFMQNNFCIFCICKICNCIIRQCKICNCIIFY